MPRRMPQARLLPSRLPAGALGAAAASAFVVALRVNEPPHLSVQFLTYRFLAEQGRRDSNPQPPVLETGALPIRATPLRFPSAVVRGKGGEPAWAESTDGPDAVYTHAPCWERPQPVDAPPPWRPLPPLANTDAPAIWAACRRHTGAASIRARTRVTKPAGAGISSWRRSASRRCNRRSWAAVA